MNSGVSEILGARLADDSRLPKLVGLSLAAHVVLVAGIALFPSDWFNSLPEQREVMVISLGGAPGPSSTGTRPISGRRVDEVVETKRPEPPQPPAAVKPDTIPLPEPPKATPKPTPTPTTKPPVAPPATTTKPPVTGTQVQQGTAVADTGASSTSTGLTLSGGDGGGDSVDLNNFNQEWVAKFRDAILRVWQQRQGELGRVELRFTILRDGRVAEAVPQVTPSSTTNSFMLVMASRRAVADARLPPLPTDYAGDRLIVRLGFDYKVK